MTEPYILSFVAGILTVLAPCILPLLSVIIGGTALHSNNKKVVTLKQPLALIRSYH